jgi:sulfur carrier protein
LLGKSIAQFRRISALHGETAQNHPPYQTGRGMIQMITIILNGKNKQVDQHTSVAQLLKNLALTEKRLAVEINQHIIPRGSYSSHIINEQDKIEIVQAIGGG